MITNNNRVFLHFSATWPITVRRLAKSYMKNPIQVYVGSLDLVAVHTVLQKIYIIDENDKTDMVNIMKNSLNLIESYTKTHILSFLFFFNRCINSFATWHRMIK